MPIFFVDRDSEGGMEQMRSQMRRNMRGGGYHSGSGMGSNGGNYREGFREGYRKGFEHGWYDKDGEWVDDEPEFRRHRDSRGRFI